jgi:FkbM family methyltransferase
VRSLLRRRGFELSWYAFPKLLATAKPDIVLDVGANEGQYAESLREAGYRGRIVSFEPLKAVHETLSRKCARDPLWTAAPPIALGSEDTSTEINVAANTYSSSILPMTAAHLQAAPQSAYVARQTVSVRRLDGIFDEFVGNGERCLLKIDVQGYERAVLRGAESSLPRICALHIEASLVELYQGEPSLRELLDIVQAAGFTLYSLSPGFIDRVSGRALQVDCFFLRNTQSN